MERRNPLTLKTRDIVRVLSLIFGFYILMRLLWVAHPVIFLFFLGVLFGLPLAQGADWLQNRRVPRPLGVAVILIAFFGLMTGGWLWLLPGLRMQSRELQQRLPEAMDKIDAWLGHRADGVLGILFNAESPTDSLRAAALKPPAADSTQVVTTLQTPSADSVGAATTVVKHPRADDVAAGGNLR